MAILELDTVNTVRGGSAMSRRMHVAEGLHGARARGSRVLFVLVVSIAKCRRREKKKKHSVEYFFLDGLWRNRHNPLAQTSAVADTIGGTAGCIAIVDRNENVAGRDHADVALIENIRVTLALILRRVLIHAIGVLHQRRPFFTRPIWPPTRLFVIRNFRAYEESTLVLLDKPAENIKSVYEKYVFDLENGHAKACRKSGIKKRNLRGCVGQPFQNSNEFYFLFEVF